MSISNSSTVDPLLASLLSKIEPNLPYDRWVQCIWSAQAHWGSSCLNQLCNWSRNRTDWDAAVFQQVIDAFTISSYPDRTGNTLHLEATTLTEAPDFKVNNRELADLTYRTAIALLKGYNNIPSIGVHEAIKSISNALVYNMENPEKKERYVYTLDTGLGKTTTVKAFIWALHELNINNVGVVVATELVDSMGTIRTELIEMGVPVDKIGVLHSKQDTDVPSIPNDQIDQYQFLLTTHARYKNRYSNKQETLQYLGEERSSMIWDEKLIKSEGTALQRSELISSIAGWLGLYEAKLADGIDINDKIKTLQAFLLVAHQSIMEAEKDTIISLPYLDPAEPWTTLLKRFPTLDNFIDLVTHSVDSGKVKLIHPQGHSSIVQFEELIPSYLPSMVILDASAQISRLVRHDSGLSIVPVDANRDHSQVTVHSCKTQSSRHGLNNTKGLWNAYLDEMKHLLTNEIPCDDDVLILTLTSKKKDTQFKEDIRARLIEMGLSYSSGRVHVETWGKHKGVNKYKQCKHVLIMGLVYRRRDEITASILGQRSDLHSTVSGTEVADTIISEQADLVYQGMSRGNLRNTVGEMAGKMDVYLFHREVNEVNNLLAYRCKGINIQPYDAQYVSKVRVPAYQHLALEIQSVLHDTVVLGNTSIGNLDLKKLINSPLKAKRAVWAKAKAYLLDDLCIGWHINGTGRSQKWELVIH